MVEAEAVEVVRQYDLLLDAHEVICFVLDYVEANQYLLTNAYSAIGQSGLKHFLYLDFVSCLERLVEQGARKEGVALDADYKQFLCAFYAEAVAGTLLDYMTHPPECSREKTVFYMERMLRSTLPAAVRSGAEEKDVLPQ